MAFPLKQHLVQQNKGPFCEVYTGKIVQLFTVLNSSVPLELVKHISIKGKGVTMFQHAFKM